MTTYYYGLDKGLGVGSATVATSTTSKSVQVVVDGASVTSKQDIMNALELLEGYIVDAKFPPL